MRETEERDRGERQWRETEERETAKREEMREKEREVEMERECYREMQIKRRNVRVAHTVIYADFALIHISILHEQRWR